MELAAPIRYKRLEDNAFMALVYFLLALLSLYVYKPNLLGLQVWIPSGVMLGVLLSRGWQGVWGGIIGAIAAAAVILFWYQNPELVLCRLVVEMLIVLLCAYSIKRFLPNSIIESSLKGLVITLIPILFVPLAGAFILASIHMAIVPVADVSFLERVQYLWLSILVGLVTLSPILISVTNRRVLQRRNFNPLDVTLVLSVSVFSSLSIIALDAFTPYTIFLSVFSLAVFLFLAFRNRPLVMPLYIGIYALSLLVPMAGVSVALPLSVQVTFLYFLSMLTFISLVISVVLREKRDAIEALSLANERIETEVQRQTAELKMLNNSLLAQIERKGIVEFELTESKSLLDQALLVGQIASWEFVPLQNQLKWSSEGYRLFGLQLDTPAPSFHEYMEMIHPDDREKFMAVYNDAVSTPTHFSTDIKHVLLSGETKYFRIKGESYVNGKGETRIVGLTQDITKQKLAEIEILEKEKKYRALFDLNIDSVLVINPLTGVIKDANQAFLHLYGYTMDEIVGQHYSIISAEPSATSVSISTAVQKGSYRIPYRIHQKSSGEQFFIEANLMYLTIDDEPSIIAISHDITPRRNAELQLAERELKYRLFFESDLVGMAEVSKQRQWISVNSKLLDILGYSQSDLIGHFVEEVTFPDDRSRDTVMFNMLLTHQSEGYNVEKRYIRPDGQVVYCKVSVKAVKNSKGLISHMVALIEDITIRKKIEDELFVSRQELKRAQELAGLGTISVDFSTYTLAMSEEAEALMHWRGGYSSRWDNLMSRVLPSARQQLSEVMENLRLGSTESYRLEMPFLLDNGDVIYFLTNLIKLKGAKDGDAGRVLITIADITRIKQAEITLQEANTMKDQLFSIIAHDLRSPIGAISSLMGIYADPDSGLTTEAKADIVSSIKTTAEETYALLENLLEWARSQREVFFMPIVGNVNTTINDSLALLSGIASSKGVSLNFMSNGLSVEAFYDSEMLKTILRNLITNAIKFTPSGGVVSVSVAKQANMVEVYIADTGVGMSPDVANSLLSGLGNISTLGTNNEKGAGLGLMLTQRFVERNGGSLRIDTEKGKGSTFAFTLPQSKKT
ncbi:MAG: PAS domain S-box protein [Bacteroidales bacterium]|nr:PAS domain S-box protein [Bacteroidales bacterium]MBN2751020.1 PAS domain S-box protein [Bacteroidales bacterium]